MVGYGYGLFIESRSVRRTQRGGGGRIRYERAEVSHDRGRVVLVLSCLQVNDKVFEGIRNIVGWRLPGIPSGVTDGDLRFVGPRRFVMSTGTPLHDGYAFEESTVGILKFEVDGFREIESVSRVNRHNVVERRLVGKMDKRGFRVSQYNVHPTR